MQNITPWFERTFPEKPPVENFPFVIERLRGTPVRVRDRTRMCPASLLTKQVNGAWSVQEHLGHLGDLEGLWYGRVKDFMNAAPELRAADLSNRRTHEANHNQRDLNELHGIFAAERANLVELLESMSVDHAGRVSRHPRLRQPMRLIDLCTFVADHDDHHLAVITMLMRDNAGER